MASGNRLPPSAWQLRHCCAVMIRHSRWRCPPLAASAVAIGALPDQPVSTRSTSCHPLRKAPSLAANPSLFSPQHNRYQRLAVSSNCGNLGVCCGVHIGTTGLCEVCIAAMPRRQRILIATERSVVRHGASVQELEIEKLLQVRLNTLCMRPAHPAGVPQCTPVSAAHFRLLLHTRRSTPSGSRPPVLPLPSTSVVRDYRAEVSHRVLGQESNTHDCLPLVTGSGGCRARKRHRNVRPRHNPQRSAQP